MAFTVEDGTGVANANSYATLAETDAYFTERGLSAWTGADDQKKAWLIQATDYVEMRFARRFIGTGKEFPDVPQGLSFPRAGLKGDETEYAGVPVPLKRAVFEYALRAKTARLAPDPTYDASGAIVRSKRTKVGPIETNLDFGSAGIPALKAYPAADMLLTPLLRTSGGVYR